MTKISTKMADKIADECEPATTGKAFRAKLAALMSYTDGNPRAEVDAMPDAGTRLAMSIAADVIDRRRRKRVKG